MLEAGLGFLAKSVFWLGLVYYAMPFDTSKPGAPLSAAANAPCPAGSPVASLAAAIPVPVPNAESLKSAAAVAAALCGHDCPLPIGAGLNLGGAGAPRQAAETANRKRVVRPPDADHIRSTDGQT